MDRETGTIDLAPVASVTGLPGILRKGRIDLPSIRRAYQSASGSLGHEDTSLVIVALDNHNSVVAMSNEDIIDASNYLEHGPFSLSSTGGLPAKGVVDLCLGSGLSKQEVITLLNNEGGVRGYTGVASFEQLDLRARDGDPLAISVLDAMVYQVAKEIGAMIAALGTKPHAIVFTGPGSRFECVTRPLAAKVNRLARLLIV